MEGQKNIIPLSDAKLEELAKDPQNLVYRFKEREQLPEAEVVPLDNVDDKIDRLYALYCAYRKRVIDKKVPMTKKRWNAIKTRILQTPEWKQFDHTHPLIFDRVMHPETTSKEIQVLKFMIFLKKKQKAGEITDGLEVLHDHVLETFGQAPEAYAEARKKEKEEEEEEKNTLRVKKKINF